MMKVVILAGGKGKRLGEITKDKPKPMVEVGDKPILETLISELSTRGLKEFVLVVSENKETIIDHFGDGSSFGVKIEYAHQKVPMGTADAVRYAEPFIDGNFIVVCGDVLFDFSVIDRMLEINKPLMCLKEILDPSGYGVVETENGFVTNIVEKSPNPPSNMVNSSIYMFPKSIFGEIMKTPISERGEYEITDSIKQLIASGERFKHINIDKWVDVGTRESLEIAKEMFS